MVKTIKNIISDKYNVIFNLKHIFYKYPILIQEKNIE